MRVLLRLPTEAPDPGAAGRPIDYHRRLPDYAESPLVEAPQLAKRLGVGKVFVKNETARFGLPSFKILGASWATYASLRERLGPLPDGPLTYERLQAWASRARPLTLVAATDGNHGRAVARVAKWFGLDAKIVVPNFVAPARLKAMEDEGAKITVIDGVYDAAVDAAIEVARGEGALLVSDTARAATDVEPRLVSQGYTTAFDEVEAQLSRAGDDRIDAVAIQAAVGGLAFACTSWARITRRRNPPAVMVVEPNGSACVMAALAAGEPITVSASEATELSLLQCGTMSLTAFDMLHAGVSACIAIEDSWAATAVSELGAAGLSVGPSGAAGAAGLLAALGGPLAEPIGRHLKISADAHLLVVATESAAASGS
jgi:diaminopropionate ammonia-lyase